MLSSNAIWRNHSRTQLLTIICSYWTIARTSDDLSQNEIKNIQIISAIFHKKRISNFNSIRASDSMTIALNFSISRDTITETHRAIRRMSRSTIENFTSTHIRIFRFISIKTFRDRDHSIEILKNNIISNSSFRNRIRELSNITKLETFSKS
jgi:hypothetical protein